MAAPHNDKPTVHATLASLDTEEAREPFRLGIKSKVIAFPDPMEMELEKAEEFMAIFADPNASVVSALQAWLSEEDYKVLKEARLTLRQVNALVQQVTAHYEDVFGTPGNGSGSTSS